MQGRWDVQVQSALCPEGCQEAWWGLEENQTHPIRTKEDSPMTRLTLPLLCLFLGCVAGYLGTGRVSEVHRHTLVLQGVDYAYWQVSQGVAHGAAVNALLNAWDD